MVSPALDVSTGRDHECFKVLAVRKHEAKCLFEAAIGIKNTKCSKPRKGKFFSLTFLNKLP